MDTRTGEILTGEQVEKLRLKDLFGSEPGVMYKGDRYKMMNIPPTPAQMKRRPPKIGRNEPCPCGSGVKFKLCCFKGDKGSRR